MGMMQELTTCESFFFLSSGVGRGSALDQLVFLSRVEGTLSTGHLGLRPRVVTSGSFSVAGAAWGRERERKLFS